MFDVLPDQIPWFIAGPALGVLIVGLFALANQPLGASGAYVHTLSFLRRRRGFAAWRVFYFVGLIVGGFVVTNVLRPSRGVRAGYDALGEVTAVPVTIITVFVGAVVLGYGAAMAGGCTSGHGMCGTAQRSPASLAVTATFMAVAIIVTLVLRVVTGGAL